MTSRMLLRHGLTDTDGSKSISVIELHTFLLKLGQNISVEDLTAAIKEVDANTNVSLELNELFKLMSLESPQNNTAVLLKKVFRQCIDVIAEFNKLDKDNSGTLSLEEFKAAFPGEASAEAAFKSIDTDHSNNISREEYLVHKFNSNKQ